MALSLSIVDNANGTATATIAGADAATVTVYTMKLDGTVWASSGSRSGNGTVTLTLTAGYYLAYAVGTVSGSPGISPVTSIFAVTTSTQSVQDRILDAVVAQIKLIAPASLPWLPVANVYKRLAVSDEDLATMNLPAVIVTATDRETLLQGTNSRDDWGKPAVVNICDRKSRMDVATMDRYTLGRERIIRYFTTQRLSGVSETIGCTVEPGLIVDPRLPLFNFLASSFLLRFRTREQRGV